MKYEACDVLKFQEAGDDTQYLGLPNILGRKKQVSRLFKRSSLRESTGVG